MNKTYNPLTFLLHSKYDFDNLKKCTPPPLKIPHKNTKKIVCHMTMNETYPS